MFFYREKIDEIVYFGSKITSDGKRTRKIKQRIELAETTVNKKNTSSLKKRQILI